MAIWCIVAIVAAPAAFLSFTVIPMNLILVAFLMIVGAASSALRWPQWLPLVVVGGIPVGAAIGVVFGVGPDAESVKVGTALAVTASAVLVLALKFGQVIGSILWRSQDA